MLGLIVGMGWQRWLTHLALAVLTVGAYAATERFYVPNGEFVYLATIAFGYEALALLVVTLVIGPLKMLAQRRNPVSIDMRRDVGIWAGITGCAHVVFGLMLHERGQILYYFFERDPRGGLRPLLNLFGVSNDLGALATVILVALLVTSNDLMLRKLKGKRWKLLQRLNYVLFALVLLHTFGYQIVSRRELPFRAVVMLITVLTLTAQFAGLNAYRAREKVGRRWRRA
jgi:methionine sulfoxide reductase heme-binding subunit